MMRERSGGPRRPRSYSPCVWLAKMFPFDLSSGGSDNHFLREVTYGETCRPHAGLNGRTTS